MIDDLGVCLCAHICVLVSRCIVSVSISVTVCGDKQDGGWRGFCEGLEEKKYLSGFAFVLSELHQ